MQTTTPIQTPVSVLSVHPDAESFPAITTEQLAVLHGSIEREGRVLEPLIATPALSVYSGRARLHCATVLGLKEVPVIFREEKDILAFCIESRVARGQLTKSGIALLLFNRHPELATGGKAGRPKKLAEVPPISSELAEEQSFRKLAALYQIDRDLFTVLREARAKLTKAQWSDLEHKVFDLEVPVGRAFAGILGGAKVGETGRMETAYFNGWEDDAFWRKSLFASSLTTVRNALARFDQADKPVKQRVLQEVVTLWIEMPEALRKACLKEER